MTTALNDSIAYQGALERIAQLFQGEKWDEALVGQVHDILESVGLGRRSEMSSGQRSQGWFVTPAREAVGLRTVLQHWKDAPELTPEVREHLEMACRAVEGAYRELSVGGSCEFASCVALNEATACLRNAARHMELADQKILPEPEEMKLDNLFSERLVRTSLAKVLASWNAESEHSDALKVDKCVSLVLADMMEGHPAARRMDREDVQHLRRYIQQRMLVHIGATGGRL